MPIGLWLIALTASAQTATVTVVADRQASISNMKAMRRIGIAVYNVNVCADRQVTVPVPRAMSAISSRGVPWERPEFVPLLMDRGQKSSALGHVRTGLEIGGALGALVAASMKAHPGFSILSGAIGIGASRAKGRQDEIVRAIAPLTVHLLRADDVLLPTPTKCHTGMMLSSATVGHVDVEIQIELPAVSGQRAALTSWGREPIATGPWGAY